MFGGGELVVKEAAAAVDERDADKGRTRLLARLDKDAGEDDGDPPPSR